MKILLKKYAFLSQRFLHLVFTIAFLLILFISTSAQPTKTDSLCLLRTLVILAPNDAERMKANENFILFLDKILQEENSYDNDFDSLKQIGILRSPDNAFRMITWNLPMDDETHQYFCYLQVPSKRKESYKVYKLNDKSEEIHSPEKKSLTKDNWYGVLYYKIIPVTSKRKTVYTLLGWDGNNSITRKKIIDVLSFTKNGEPKFGEDIFHTRRGIKKRIIFEYSANAVMSLKYHPERKQIVYDHLSPSQPEMEGMYQYYGPDLSFDAFELEKGKWVYKEDVDIRSEIDNPVYNPEINTKERSIYAPK